MAAIRQSFFSDLEISTLEPAQRLVLMGLLSESLNGKVSTNLGSQFCTRYFVSSLWKKDPELVRFVVKELETLGFVKDGLLTAKSMLFTMKEVKRDKKQAMSLEWILGKWNELARKHPKGMQQRRVSLDNIENTIRDRVKESGMPYQDMIVELFKKIDESDYLTARNRQIGQPGSEWTGKFTIESVFSPSKFAKILEGGYSAESLGQTKVRKEAIHSSFVEKKNKKSEAMTSDRAAQLAARLRGKR